MLRNGRILGMKTGLYAEKAKVRIAIPCLKIKKQLQYLPKRNGRVTVAHVTLYAAGNAGDTALSECVRRTFNREYGNPLDWHLTSVYRRVDSRMIQRINKTQMLLIGGGGLFLPDTNKNFVSGWEWACGKELLQEIKIPIILYSVGYNYFRGQRPGGLFIDNLNTLVEKSSFVGLRNHGSVEAVRSLLREPLRDKVCYQPCTTTLIRRIMPDLPPKRDSGKIAFNFAFDRAEMRFGAHQEEILNEVIHSMYQLRDNGYEIYLTAHCTNDLSMLSMVRDWKNIHAVNAAAWDLNKLTRFYNEMDVVLGMRGHAQMIPFGVNCHIISLGSHEKMRWFLEDIGAADWYVELTEDIPTLSDRIVDKFEEIHERSGKETTQRIAEAQDGLMRITRNNMNEIKSRVTNRGGYSIT